EVRRRRRPVRGGIKMGLDHYPVFLLDSLPRLYESLAADFRAAYRVELPARDLPVLVRFGSWIGGDRDGNPYVTPTCTRDALQMARRVILDHYINATTALLDRLSASTLQVAASSELQQALDLYAARFTTSKQQAEARAPYELYPRLRRPVLHPPRASFDVPPPCDAYA